MNLTLSSSMPPQSRREFIGSTCCAAVGYVGLLSALSNLRLIGAVASPGNIPARAAATSDYRALVCLFLNGGNDANNLIVPTGPGPASDPGSYAAYAAARSIAGRRRRPALAIAGGW